MELILRVSKIVLMGCFVIIILLIIGSGVLFYQRIHDVQVLTNQNEASSVFLHAYGLGHASSDWEVTDKQIKMIVNKLNMTLRSEKTLIPSYKLQLLEYEKDGERFVYYNGFCFAIYSEVKEYWQKKLVLVNDGGNCFFGGSYNLNNHDIESFRFGD